VRPARMPMMVMTARSSIRVKAAVGRRGVKGLRDKGVFKILDS
jgi:hypothetical protein